jgi:hypothetical protein
MGGRSAKKSQSCGVVVVGGLNVARVYWLVDGETPRTTCDLGATCLTTTSAPNSRFDDAVCSANLTSLNDSKFATGETG